MFVKAKPFQGSNIGKIENGVIDIVSGTKRIITFLDSKDANCDDSREGRHATLVSAREICAQLTSADGINDQTYKIISGRASLNDEKPANGDILVVSRGIQTEEYSINIIEAALAGKLELDNSRLTKETSRDIVLDYYAGQRTPEAEVNIYVPKTVSITMENTTVDIIGRGAVSLSGFSAKSVGRVAVDYKYQTLGNVEIVEGETHNIVKFTGLDLRPDNGVDLRLRFANVSIAQTGEYTFRAELKTKEPCVLQSPGTGSEETILHVVDTVTDFCRVLDKSLEYKETPETYNSVKFAWTTPKQADSLRICWSTDDGRTWNECENGKESIGGLEPDKLHLFKLKVEGGPNAGYSNIVQFYSGKLDVRKFGAVADGVTDNKDAINKAITWLNETGGGTLLFSGGTFKTRTVYLKSNVYLYVDSDAVIEAYIELLQDAEAEADRVYLGMDEPEDAWWSYKDYISGTNDGPEPYDTPDNFLSKQDVGHCFFASAMFYAKRADNIKIIGTGTIDGYNVLNTSDKVMNNGLGNHANKMIALKLCTNIELGGKNIGKDLLFDTSVPYMRGQGRPFYAGMDAETSAAGMLKIERGGHFVVLATGCDNFNVHDVYYQYNHFSNARDVYDFMATGNVTVTNVFAGHVSDDIVKLGSDCALGYTVPVRNFLIRNVIGATNCNLFQIGSETADDIKDVWIDNITILSGNKSGFSISTNDGAHVENIYLNTGKTGAVLGISHMSRTTTPFFFSISNRGRIIGAKSVKHDNQPRIVYNVNSGKVANIHINDLDISDVYGGHGTGIRDKDGNMYTEYTPGVHREFTSTIAGYKMPDYEGALAPPDGRTTAYIEDIHFNNVKAVVKGGHPAEHGDIIPPELKVGSYNVPNFGIRPAYGYFVRHVRNISFKNCSVGFEKNDDRYALVLDNVHRAEISGLTAQKGIDAKDVVKITDSVQIKTAE